jgi:phage-related protein
VGNLQGAMSSIQAAVQPIANGLRAVTSFVSGVANCADQVVNAAESAVSSVVTPLAAVASRVQSMIASAENVIAIGGGVLPGVPAATNIYNALSKMNAAVQLPELYELRSITARMQVNLPLTAAPTSLKSITVGGGDLYTIASQQYGDATRWTDIATANGLTDPVLTGINTLVIPA